MGIKKIKIKNFKCFKDWTTINFNKNINILVGNNEAGKSTILEAINLALTGIYRGRYIKNEISQYLFNKDTISEYLTNIEKGNKVEPPEIIIEVYFDDTEDEKFIGDGNSEHELDTPGIVFSLAFDQNYRDEYEILCFNDIKTKLISLPIEYYEATWLSFAREHLTLRSIPIKSLMIDSSNSLLNNGSDIYISRIVKNILEDKDVIGIAQAHRCMKENFAEKKIITDINKKLTSIGVLESKNISISVDFGTRNSWENSLITELDEIPYENIGKGAQCILKTGLALTGNNIEKKSVILIEEPESHLSYSNLNILLNNFEKNNNNKQIIISTHSSFVANKLSLNNLLLLNNHNLIKINDLSKETNNFFKKISGYDTLRFILCKKSILVEGDSDELIVQSAYLKYNEKLPIQDGIDVISVGTSFLRFLEIAQELDKEVIVITDNDGNIENLEKKYKDYLGNNKKKNIKICYDNEVHNYTGSISNYNNNTLEPCLLRCNSLKKLNKILKKDYKNEDDMLKYMYNNKTEVALKIFETEEDIVYPKYILEAIKQC